MNNELRAKFEAWFHDHYPLYSRKSVEAFYTQVGYHAGHASRDAEVEAFKSFFSQFRSIPEDEWLSLSGLVRRTGSSVEFSRLSVTTMAKESGE